MKSIRLALLVILMLTISVSAQAADKLPGNPEWYKANLYVVKELDDSSKVILLDKKTVSTLKNFSYYEEGGKRELKLVSKLGFVFKNIPTDNTYFFNECIATFLEGEELLPKAQEWLKANDYKSKDLTGLIFEFPDKPKISEKKGYTVFPYGQKWISTGRGLFGRQKGYWTTRWILGLADTGEIHAYVTYGYKHSCTIIVHEYIHLCGYGGYYHDKHVILVGELRSTYEK